MYIQVKKSIMKIKIIILLALSLLTNLLFADQAPDNKSKYQIIDDSVHYTDGKVISFEEFSNENKQLDSIHLLDGSVYSIEEYKKLLPSFIKKSKKAKSDNKNENTPVENGRIISNWKFYTIMLAFPIFLILLFILVFIRGRRSDK